MHQNTPNPPLATAPTREILVNGTRHLVRAEHLDHAQLVDLAFPRGAGGRPGSSALTIAYRGGPHAAPDGLLAPGERIPVAEGEAFVVTRTDRS